MALNIERIISFRLSGKFAHFSKFYTNSSSLSYIIPPRTAIAGLLASILKIPRDEYYEKMSEERLGISVKIPEGMSIRKQTHSMNNLHSNYYKLITTGKGKVMPSQCKMELLLGPPEGLIEYIVFVGADKENETFKDIHNSLNNGNMGYGIYLGQRQFKAEIIDLVYYKKDDIVNKPLSEWVDSICLKENIVDLEMSENQQIIVEQIPVAFKKITNKNLVSREPVSIKDVIFERNGKVLKGKFKNCYHIAGQSISFY